MTLRKKILSHLKVRPWVLALAVIAVGVILLAPASAQNQDNIFQYVLYDDLSNSVNKGPKTSNGNGNSEGAGECDQGLGNGGEDCNPNDVINNDEGDSGPGDPGAND